MNRRSELVVNVRLALAKLVLSALVIHLLWGISGRLACGQPKPAGATAAPTGQPPEPVVSAADVEAQLKQLDQAGDLDEPTKGEVGRLLGEALALLQTAERYEAEAAQFEDLTRRVPERLRQVRAELDQRSAPAPATAEIYATLERLDQVLQQKVAAADSAKQLAADLSAQSSRRLVAQNENPLLIDKGRSQLAALEKQLADVSVPNGNPRLAAARRMLLESQRRAIQAEISRLANELRYYEASKELFPLEQRLAALQVSAAEEQVAGLREQVNRRRQLETQQKAQQVAREAAEAHLAPALRSLAERNKELASEEAELATQMKKSAEEMETATKTRDELTQQDQRTRERVENIGLTPAVGLLLRTQRAALRDVRKYHRAIQARQKLIPSLRLRLYELEDDRLLCAELLRRVETAREGRGSVAGFAPDQLPRAAELLATQLALLDQLHKSYLGYLRTLGELDTAQRRLIQVSEQFADFIDQRILWIPTAGPLELKSFVAAMEAALEIASAQKWLEVIRAMGRDLQQQPLLNLLALLVFLGWLAVQRRLRYQLAELGQAASQSKTLRLLPTLNAVLITVAIAAFWPGLLVWMAWRLSASWEATSFVQAVALGCLRAAGFLFPLEVLRQACRPMGVAQVHFGWPKGSTAALRSHLRWLVPLGAVAVLLAGMCESPGMERWQAHFGRIQFILAMLLVAACCYGVLRPQGPFHRHLMASGKVRWFSRLRSLWCVVAMAAPLSIAVLAGWGYYYTADRLAARLLASLYVPLGLALVGGVGSRWILLVRRRLAMTWAKRRAAEAAAIPPRESTSPVPPPTPAGQIDLTTVSQQTQRLVQGVLVIVAAVALWLIWSDVLPALMLAAGVPIWQYTLGQLATVIAVIVVTGFLAKNVPGLLQLLISQQVSLDAGTRHAVRALVTYLIVLVGLVLACGKLGLQWSSIQWLVAALSVGLGFGLQEIVANFVSGIIILFEQPIRVGDVVSVDGVTGVVSKIRIRATIITNWERQEFIVPNKEFITGRVLNWTLSDSINRIVVEVGVAYGSDVARTRELLLQIAREHPAICSDPAPSVVLQKFGDSTLQFVLRCYLPNLNDRLDVIHHLHATIHDRFRQEGIEIAFPQLDVHLSDRREPTA